ncbi:sodium/calcium exchanger NCL2-like [Salvia divinorum]|uniref:Sodium/calcium exchanger NCL2-like n=1 Tax=Salvia divinorum TaxID=28513 RepID=A0ABD1IG17_SALDI
MLFSVVPLTLVQLLGIFRFSPSLKRHFLLALLLVYIIFLISYFLYQFFLPWIQRRRLLYIKHKHLVVDILKQVQNQTQGNLLTDNGSPNVSIIRRY